MQSQQDKQRLQRKMVMKSIKTRTGWKFDIAVISEHPGSNNVIKSTILCTRRPNRQLAEQAAKDHIQTHLINFVRFATEEEAIFLGDSFSKSLTLKATV